MVQNTEARGYMYVPGEAGSNHDHCSRGTGPHGWLCRRLPHWLGCSHRVQGLGCVSEPCELLKERIRCLGHFYFLDGVKG